MASNDLNYKLACQQCRNPVPNIVEEFASGDMVCGDCGLVLGDRIIDTRSEWRTFANDDGDDPSRVGAASNPLLDGDQLDTVIARADGGSGIARELNKIHGRSSAAKGERMLLGAYKDISSMCDRMQLNQQISNTAKQIYKRVEDGKVLRGKPTESIIATCIFVACRNENVPRTFKEIFTYTRVPKREISRCFKVISNLLNTNVGATNSENLMARFCSHLNMPMPVQRVAINVTKEAKELGTLAGKSPVSVAAACIYMVSHLMGMPCTPKDVSKVAGVSETTIKNSYKSLYEVREKLLRSEIVENADLSRLMVPSSRRKCRKAHFTAPSHERRKIMSSTLSKELREKHKFRAIPIHKDDEVRVISGSYKGREGRVVQVYRKKYVIHIDRLVREKANGATVPIGVHPSNVEITKFKINKARQDLIDRKTAGKLRYLEIKQQ
ncbi:transcription initiation factor IIB [Dispira simplex]|nr:transcription initiation factor IIB [Dispira simplex]